MAVKSAKWHGHCVCSGLAGHSKWYAHLSQQPSVGAVVFFHSKNVKLRMVVGSKVQ